MKPIEVDVFVSRPRQAVWDLFTQPDKMTEWVQGFESMRLLDGEPETVGSVHELVFREGKREVRMRETVTAFEAPRHFAFDAEAPGMTTHSETFFLEEEGGTRIRSQNAFHPQNLLMRLMMPLMKGGVRRRIQGDFERFAALAEREISAAG